MIQNECTFHNQDGLELFYHEWLPENQSIKAIVFIVHGVGEHSGRYRHVAEAFTNAGFACYGIDHRGHGKSGGLRVYIEDLEYAVEDLRQLFEQIKTQYPEKSFLIFGHSMGSLVSLMFVLKYQEDIKALALSGTAIKGEDLQPGWLVSLAIRASKYIPKVRLSPPASADILTSDPEQVKQWDNDPLTDKGMWRVGTSAAMLLAGRQILKDVHQLTLPILAVHGEDDQLTPTTGATYLQDNASSTDVTVKTYPKLRHEVVNEVDREQVIQDVVDWLVAHA